MDPDANLDSLRTLIAQLIKQIDNTPNPWEGLTSDIDTDAIDRVLELFQALDQWIGRGGFLPAVWRNAAMEDEQRSLFTMSRSELGRLLQDYDQILAQVTNTQASNTALVEQNRLLKARVQELEDANARAAQWALDNGDPS